MAQTAAVLVDRVMPRAPVRRWVLWFPIPLRILLAAHREVLTPVLGIVQRVITGFPLGQSGLTGTTHIVMHQQAFLQRLAARVPHPRLHLIRFTGCPPRTRRCLGRSAGNPGRRTVRRHTRMRTARRRG